MTSCELTPRERFVRALASAIEAENGAFSADEINRIALFLARWMKWNAPETAGSEWWAHMAGEE